MARCRRNVDNFLEACRKIGVEEVSYIIPLHTCTIYKLHTKQMSMFVYLYNLLHTTDLK